MLANLFTTSFNTHNFSVTYVCLFHFYWWEAWSSSSLYITDSTTWPTSTPTQTSRPKHRSSALSLLPLHTITQSCFCGFIFKSVYFFLLFLSSGILTTAFSMTVTCTDFPKWESDCSVPLPKVLHWVTLTGFTVSPQICSLATDISESS
jgi:hypothetical protein